MDVELTQTESRNFLVVQFFAQWNYLRVTLVLFPVIASILKEKN